MVKIDFIQSTNLNIGEAAAALMIIQEPVRLCLKKMIVQGDSNLVVQAINRKKQVDYEKHHQNIKHLLGNFKA